MNYEFPDFNMISMKSNGFVNENVIGRKDQFDLDYAIFRKAIKESETREDMINYIEEKMQYVISRVASERAKTLMEGRVGINIEVYSNLNSNILQEFIMR